MEKYNSLSDYADELMKSSDRSIKALEISRKFGIKMLEKHFINKIRINTTRLMCVAIAYYTANADDPGIEEWYNRVHEKFEKILEIDY